MERTEGGGWGAGGVGGTGRRAGKRIIKFLRGRMSQMRKNLTWLRVGEVYSTTSPEEEDATSGREMPEEVRRGEGYLCLGSLLDNPTVELRGSAFSEACFPACLQMGAWISRRDKVGPP